MKYQSISNITLWVLLLLGVVVAVLFFGMGNEEAGHVVAGDTLEVPKGTGLMMAWNYILAGLTLLATFGFVIVGYAGSFKKDAKHALTVLGILVAFVLLFVVCWFLGSPEKIEIIGYDGTDNQGFWANLADMMMYATYVLVLLTFSALVFGLCYSKYKK